MSREIPLQQQERVLIDLSDEKTKCLMGWPGYRNAEGRSGLGYFETQSEWAHMQGTMLRKMIVGDVLTRNPIFLFFMFFVAMIYSLPIILGLPDILAGRGTGLYILIINPYWIVGLLIFRNIYLAVFGQSVENHANQ